jgi:hypothetical protein
MAMGDAFQRAISGQGTRSRAGSLTGGVEMNGMRQKRGGWSWWYLLFIVQFVLVLWPPLYNQAEPYWLGIPFFYWYQLLCVLIGAVFTAVVYFATDA